MKISAARCNGTDSHTRAAACSVLALLLACAGAACAQTAERQSPIDIHTSAAVRSAVPAITASYQADANLNVVNTYDPHHAPRVDKEWATLRADVPAGSYITTNGQRFDLLQFHFHTPAEHAVNQRRAPMEVHFVHLRQGAQPCESDALLVIGARIRRGKAHNELDKIFGLPALPQDAGAGALTVANFDIGKVLPALAHSWRYSGSLTAPSSFDTCALAEGAVEQQLASKLFPQRVSWVVLRDQIEMSAAQIEKFRRLFHEGNSRELQPRHARDVIRSLP